MKVLVAVDDSPYSKLAIEQLGAGAWWGDTEFCVLHVAMVPTVRQWETWGLDVDRNMREKVLAEAQKLVDEQVGLLQKQVTAGIKVEGKVLESSEAVADTIIAEAVRSETDLIVVGARSHNGFDRIVFGSVAENVLSKAPCSVEVVKSEIKDTDKKSRAVKSSGNHSTTDRNGKLNENNHAHGVL